MIGISMKIKFISIIALTVLLLNFQAAAAPKVYKCLDKYGRPTYSTLSTCNDPTQVTLKKHQKKVTTQKKVKIKNKELTKECKKAKRELVSYTKARFLTKTVIIDDKPQVKRLSAEEKAEAIDNAQENVKYWCKT